MKVEDILKSLTKDERFDKMVWVGKNYSIRDLKNDLKELEKTNEADRKD
jgi:hypothetical protein